MYKYIFFIVASVLLLSLISCGNETETFDDSALGFDFSPVEVNKYWMYKSDSIVYLQGGNLVDTLSGFIREEITDTFLDSEGNLAYRLERFFKRELSDTWSQPRVWTITKDAMSYTVTEENLRFVKMIFPLDAFSRWDGNIFIDPSTSILVGADSIKPYRGIWDYRVEDIDTSYSFNGLEFDDVVRILHIDQLDFIEKRFSEEQYARGVGLVYKKISFLDTQCSPNCVGETIEDFAESGFIVELQLMDHN